MSVRHEDPRGREDIRYVHYGPRASSLQGLCHQCSGYVQLDLGESEKTSRAAAEGFRSFL